MNVILLKQRAPITLEADERDPAAEPEAEADADGGPATLTRPMSDEERRRFDAKLAESYPVGIIVGEGEESAADHAARILAIWREVESEMAGERATAAATGALPVALEDLVPADQDVHGEWLVSAADVLRSDR